MWTKKQHLKSYDVFNHQALKTSELARQLGEREASIQPGVHTCSKNTATTSKF